MLELLISLLITILLSVVMGSVGLYQIKSKDAVGFYTFTEKPKNEQISDVKAWNVYHGTMFVAYAVIILISWAIGYLVKNSIASTIIFCCGVIVPFPLMIFGHRALVKKYYVK